MLTERHLELGGTHHGRLPVAPPRPPDVRQDAPRDRPRIRLVLGRIDVRRVIDGDKTRHARLWADTDPDEGPCQVGDRVPVQKRGHGVICHVVITAIDMRELGEMDIAEARLHGYRTTRDYQRAWLAENDTAFRRLDADALADVPPEDVEAAWARYADLSVWVFTFHVDQVEALRYLAPKIGKKTSSNVNSDAARGYVSDARRSLDPDAPVTFSNVELERWSLDSERRHDAHHRQLTAEQLEQRAEKDSTLIEQFARTVEIARALNIDPRSQIRLVGRAHDQLRKAIKEHADPSAAATYRKPT